jgi:hypothetical protein
MIGKEICREGLHEGTITCRGYAPNAIPGGYTPEDTIVKFTKSIVRSADINKVMTEGGEGTVVLCGNKCIAMTGSAFAKFEGHPIHRIGDTGICQVCGETYTASTGDAKALCA